MSKILIGSISANHPSRWHYRTIQRENCFQDHPVDYIFVVGRNQYGTRPEPDALQVDCDDSKEYMVLKNQALFRYALEKGYDYCFRVCDDTWVFPKKLAEAGLEPFDYAGMMPCKINLGGTFKVWMRYLDYMHGGCGIWLSRKAMEMLVADVWKGPDWVQTMPELMELGMGLKMARPRSYWDDHWIGEVLKGNLAWDDPIRQNPVQAYANNGIAVLEDDMVFYNDDPTRPVSIHDPGKEKQLIPMPIIFPEAQ